MDKSKSSAPARPVKPTREEKGLRLAREHFEEIWCCGAGSAVWRVPSCSESETIYLVRLKPEFCPCEDFRRRRETCKHLFAAWTVRAKTAPCEGCGERFRRRELVEVTEDHESLTFFDGDLLCDECARAHGVL